MIHILNINGERVDVDKICDTYITPFTPLDKAYNWIVTNHPELKEYESRVKTIINEWQNMESLY